MAERPFADQGWLLGIDTSSDLASIALRSLAPDALDVAEISWPAARNQTATLLREIEHLCRVTGIESGQLAGIAVAIGPGGFNALRVGLSVAKSLAFAGNLPIVGIQTLDLTARAVADWGRPVRACVPAGRRRMVYADYQFRDGHLRRLSELHNVDIDELADGLTTGTVFAGDFTSADAALLAARPHVIMPTESQRRRRAGLLLDLALPRFQAGDVDDLAGLEPIYLHRTTEPAVNS